MISLELVALCVSAVVGAAYANPLFEGWYADPANEVKWAKGAMWAPDAQEKDGKYYLFFAANGAYPNQSRNHCVICQDRMYFNTDGSIKPVVMTPAVSGGICLIDTRTS